MGQVFANLLQKTWVRWLLGLAGFGAALALLAAGGLFLVRLGMTARRLDDGRLLPSVVLAVAPLPKQLPLMGTSGRDEDGYPTQYIDRAAMRSLLLHREFTQLSRYVEELEKRFERDYRTEYWITDAVESLAMIEPAVHTLVAAWVAATPKSFAPYLIRAAQRIQTGAALRGTRLYKDTPPADIEAMLLYFALARQDLALVLKRRAPAFLVSRAAVPCC